jgi:RNA polymerase sigma factor (sigma-70 family)
VLARVRRWLTQADPDADADLLRRFADRRDEGAFTVLVDRHGPMVLGVARRVTADGHAAEDVFQATFLALARRAAGLRRPAAVAAWLHRTAHRLALTAARARGRRQRAEAAVPVRPGRDPLADISGRELVSVLDEELRRFPARYRQPLVLCCLEGRSPDEAATLLGWSPGSLRGRLERGRRLLRARLTRRGLTFAVGAGTSLLLVGPQALPGALRARVLAAVLRGGQASPAVAALASAGSRIAPVRGILMTAVCGLAGLAAVAAVSSQPPVPKAPPRADGPPATTRPDPPLPAGAVARLGWDPLRMGVARAALAPDGKRVIAVSATGIVHVFEATTGRLLDRRPLGDRRDVFTENSNFSLSADGRVATVAEYTPEGGRVTAYRTTDGKQLARVAPVEDHGLSADGRLLATIRHSPAHGGNVLEVRDLQTDRSQVIVLGAGGLYRPNFTPDGKRILGFTDINSEGLVCFDVPNGKQMWSLPEAGRAHGATADGRSVVVAGRNAKDRMRAIDLETGRPTDGMRLPSLPATGEIVPAGDRLLLIPLTSGEVVVWDHKAGKELRRLRASAREFFSVRLFASADGKTAMTDADGLRRWDLATGDLIFGPAAEPAHFGQIQALEFLPGGALIAADTGAELRRWDVAGGRVIGPAGKGWAPVIRATPLGVRTAKVDWSRLTVLDGAGKAVGTINFPDDKTPVTPDQRWDFALLGDGRRVVTHLPRKGRPAVVAVTDYLTGKTLSQTEIPDPSPYGCFQGFSPCGRWLVHKGEVYSVTSGHPVWTPSAGEGWEVAERSLAHFSSDGRLLCLPVSVSPVVKAEDLGKGGFDVWEVASGSRLARLNAKHIGRAAYSPDNRIFAYTTGYGVHLVDLIWGKLVAEYAAPGINNSRYFSGPAATLAFSPDGRSVATGHVDGSIMIWKVPVPTSATLTKADATAAWADLASTDAMKARTAIDRLAREPDVAVALLSERFKAPQPPAEADVPALIKALDSSTFAAREKAARQLREVGPKARPALQEALKTATPEAKERIERLLAEFDPIPKLPLTGDALRGTRAIEVLERIGTPAANTQLQAWAEQSADVSLAAEAGMALERLRVWRRKPEVPRK